MSIYASMGAPDDCHAETCGVYVETPPGSGCLEWRREEDCTCKLRHAPIVYQGSHVLPSLDDERGGSVDIALIPGFIQREGRAAERPDNDEGEDFPAWPFLRFGVNEGVVVLDKPGVEQIVKTLSHWLERVDGGDE